MSAKATDPNTPVGVDPTRASVARVYDALLGGKDNYEVDRQVMRELVAAMPDIAEAARENRNFLIRVCRFIARETGVTQYLDCGSGLPTAENTHQVVQRFNPDSKVVYVDNDPVVLAHGRALLEEDERTRLVGADVYLPSEVLQSETVRTHLDFTEPIALFALSLLHNHKGDRDRPAEVMREYVDAPPSGSYVAISHAFDPETEDRESRQALERALETDRCAARPSAPATRSQSFHRPRNGHTRPGSATGLVAGRSKAQTTQRRAAGLPRRCWPQAMTGPDTTHDLT